ncbi:MAG: hypothetical protein GY867_06960 [bacterium]|nr:hypothetical protein [bacterium]
MTAKQSKSKKRTVGGLRLLSDQPIVEGPPSESDGLGFREYAQVLGEAGIQTPGPFTVGIFGEWGTGKTSLLRIVEEYLRPAPNVITVWFNAWRYESEDQPIVPLVATIVKEIERNRTFCDRMADEGKALLRGLRAVAYGFSANSKLKIPGFAEIEASFVAKDMIDHAEAISADPLLDRSVFFEAFRQLSSIKMPDDTRIVVLIDDLDRCFPDKAIRLLESIKLVLAQPGFIFYLAVARKVIEGYLRHRYEKEFGITGFDGHDYLDKIVQLPFHIPPHENRMANFWDSIVDRLDAADKADFRKLVPIIGLASGANPRTAVRFVNNLLVDRAIFGATAGAGLHEDMPIPFFAVSRSIQQRWPSIFWLLSLSEVLCNEVAEWMSDKLPSEIASDSHDSAKALDILRTCPELTRLLRSEFGASWLKDHKQRTATIDFLQSQRTEDLHSRADHELRVKHTATVARHRVQLDSLREFQSSEVVATKVRIIRQLVDLDASLPNLNRSHLVGADLSNTRLAGVDFSEADLHRADLGGAVLAGADLSYANLSDGVLCFASLSHTDLHNANLSNADLSGADLGSAILTEADMWNADLYHASNLTWKQLKSTKHWEKATHYPQNVVEEAKADGVDLIEPRSGESDQ